MIEIWKMCLILIGAVGITVAGALWYQKKQAQKFNQIMIRVDDTIESLIRHEEKHYFSETEDTLLGKFQYEIMKLHDILTSYEEREKELRKELNSSISDLVHQINTPISNIKMYGGFLLDSVEEEQQKAFAANIVAQTEKLSWLGEGFGKLSRLETGIITLYPEKQLLLPTLLQAIDQISLKACQHGNNIELKGNQKLMAVFDSKWTEEVFYNLLDNGVKYSDPGSTITVELVEYELYIRINVISYGQTIDEDEYAKIFQRFYRGRQVKNQDGVGLGLYLARKIIHGQKGYMKVESRKEKETMVSVFLLNT